MLHARKQLGGSTFPIWGGGGGHECAAMLLCMFRIMLFFPCRPKHKFSVAICIKIETQRDIYDGSTRKAIGQSPYGMKQSSESLSPPTLPSGALVFFVSSVQCFEFNCGA